MNTAEIKDAVIKYRKIFEQHGIGKTQHPDDTKCISRKASLEHSHWILDQIEKFLARDYDKKENFLKAMRWLCFVQHDIWVAGYLTINDLKDDNRSKKKTT